MTRLTNKLSRKRKKGYRPEWIIELSKRKDDSIMKTQELAYKPYGIGSWTYVTVSKDVAQALANEYSNYGWDVKIDGNAIETELALKAA